MPTTLVTQVTVTVLPRSLLVILDTCLTPFDATIFPLRWTHVIPVHVIGFGRLLFALLHGFAVYAVELFHLGLVESNGAGDVLWPAVAEC